jgi:hypothetical protein
MAKFCSRSDSYLLQYGLVFYLCLLGQFLGRSRSSSMVPNKGLQMSYISRPSIESNLIKDLDHCIDLTESHSGLIILIRLLVDLLEQSTHDLISQVILDVQKARLHFFPHERIFLDRNTPSLLANANYILSIYTHIYLLTLTFHSLIHCCCCCFCRSQERSSRYVKFLSLLSLHFPVFLSIPHAWMSSHFRC